MRRTMQEVRTMALVLLLGASAAWAEGPSLDTDKQALAPLQTYVGDWRGVGLPRRGSNAGAWTESSNWSWTFAEDRAQLVSRLKGGKYYSRLELRPGQKPGHFVLLGVTDRKPDGLISPPDEFTGMLDDGVLTVTSQDPTGERPARITIRMVAGGDRMLVRYEKRIGDDVYARLAEVGSTREGSSFAKNAASGPECVVTGGLGTIAVMHDGKTYYVCCGGCRDLFEEDSAAVLAEYYERKKVERAEKKQ